LGLVHIGLSPDPARLARQHGRHAAGGATLLGVKPRSTLAEANRVHVHELLPWHVRHYWYEPSPEVVAWVLSLPVQFPAPAGWPPL
jgi:hypothetical protein